LELRQPAVASTAAAITANNPEQFNFVFINMAGRPVNSPGNQLKPTYCLNQLIVTFIAIGNLAF
jgi:hypothetical protein